MSESADAKPQRGVRLTYAIRRFGPYVWRYRGRAGLVLVLGILAGALEKAPFLFLYTLLNSVLGFQTAAAVGEGAKATTGVLPKIDEWVKSFAPWIGEHVPGLSNLGDATDAERIAWLIAIATGVIVVALLGALAKFAFVQISRGLSLRILADLRQDLASHVLKLGMGYHTASKKGDLLSRATTDVTVVLTALQLFFDDLILEPAQLLANLGLTLISDPWMTLLVLVLLPLIAGPLLIFGRRVRKGTRRSLSALGESTEAMSQMFSGIRVVKSFRMEKRELSDFRETNERWISKAMTVVRAKALTEGSTQLLTNAGFALLLCGIGFAHLKWHVLSDVGAMSVWFIGFATMYQHIRRISKGYQTIQESMGAAERLFEVLDQKPAVTATARGTRKLTEPVRELRADDLVYAYGEERVLDGVTFEARAGETIAIVGPSGAGKSTLLDLVARFDDPQGGSLRVNGIDVRDLDVDDWFRHWALVDQQPFLFHASIRENVAYGRPNATDDEVRAALRAANLLEFVESLPQGIRTEVGDRGARLSGGQRQRLTIARALLMNPPILLLDEATSALDSESEAAVREALDRLMAGRTSIVVAHRLSTIRNATRILVLERGRIVEQGRHDELLRAGGAYRRIHDAQFQEAAA